MPALANHYRLDGKGFFRNGLASIRTKLEERCYTSVSGFSAHLASVFTSEIGVQPAGDTAELQAQMGGRAPELSLEQREKRKFAKRIIKAIQPALEEAIRNESELNRKPFENELKELDVLLEESVQSRRGSPALDEVEKFVTPAESNGIEPIVEAEEADAAGELEEPPAATENPGDAVPDAEVDQVVELSEHLQDTTTTAAPAVPESDAQAEAPLMEAGSAVNGDYKEETDQATIPQNGPLTPPLSFQEDQTLPLAKGGVQWYMQPFDPVGTTIYEERWTGRDVMRGMSEELSELDEDELKDLVEDEPEAERPKKPARGTQNAQGEPPVKVHRTRRWKGFQ